jgi:hypothetical protein
VPRTRKEQAAAARLARSDSSTKMRQAMKTGDEKYLPARDRGPVKRFIRDMVDSRFSFVELMIPVLLVTTAMAWSGNKPPVASYGNAVLFGMLLLIVVDMAAAAVQAAPRAHHAVPRRAPQGHDLLRDHALAADEVHATAEVPGPDRPEVARALPVSPGFAWGLVAGLAAAALFRVSAAVAQAHAVRRQPHRPHGLVDFVRLSVRDPWTLGVVVAYLLGLRPARGWRSGHLPLYLAQATVAMSLPITAVTSIVLHEHLRPGATGRPVGLVSVGLVLLSVSSGEPGELFTSVWFAAALCGWASRCCCSPPASGCTGPAR